mgnify:CR=1 FL=1
MGEEKEEGGGGRGKKENKKKTDKNTSEVQNRKSIDLNGEQISDV